MSKLVPISPSPSVSTQGLSDNLTQNHTLDSVNRVGYDVIQAGSIIKENKKLDNGVYLLAGDHGGFQVEGSRSAVVAAPGSVVKKQITITGQGIITGVSVVCDGNKPAVVVKSGGRLILKDCHITKVDNLQKVASDSYVLVESGGYATINGCMFHGSQSNIGALVYNDDAINPSRVAVVGAVNLTDVLATAYTNVGYAQDIP